MKLNTVEEKYMMERIEKALGQIETYPLMDLSELRMRVGLAVSILSDLRNPTMSEVLESEVE